MQQIAYVSLYFLRDLFLSLSLYLVVRFVLLLPCKRSLPALILFPLLLLGNAAAFAVFYLKSPENARAAADILSFLLSLLFVSSQLQHPGSGWKTVLLVGLLLDFTVEVLYSLISQYGSDAPLLEAGFGVLAFGVFSAGIYYMQKKKALNVLPGAIQKIPKPLFVVFLFFEFTCYYREFGEAASWYLSFYRISSVAVIACLFWMFFRIAFFAKEETQLLEQLSLQKEYGLQLQQNDASLRQFRHDYRNHMIVVNAYMENGDLAAAREYLQAVHGVIDPALRRISCGNFAADAILNYKRAEAEAQQIGVSFRGKIPSKGIRDEDVCTVLSNLLDNAIEACAALAGDRTVFVCGQVKNGWFLLSTENPAPLPVDPSKSSKADEKNHGYGLKNVKRVVKKYNGHLSFEQADGQVTVTARMRAPE